MARISKDDFPALEQQGMIIGRIGGETCFDRQTSNHTANRVEFGALHQSKTRMSGRETAEQSHKTGGKQGDTSNCPFRKSPTSNQIAPQKWKDQEITPHHQLEIVPVPGRCLNKITNAKNHSCRQHEYNVSWRLFAPMPSTFPNAPATKTYQRHHQQNPQSKVSKPELKERRDYAVPSFLQQSSEASSRSKIGGTAQAKEGSAEVS